MRLMMIVIMLGMMLMKAGGLSKDMEDFERMMEEPQDRSGWVNPMDMGFFDSQPTCKELEAKANKCDKDLTACKLSLENSGKKNNKSANEDCKQSRVESKSSSDVFLRRYVNYLISKLRLDPTQDSHLKLEIVLSSFEIQTLFNYASLKSSTPAVDVDSILSTHIRSWDYYETSPFFDELKVNMCISLTFLFVCILIYKIINEFCHVPTLYDNGTWISW